MGMLVLGRETKGEDRDSEVVIVPPGEVEAIGSIQLLRTIGGGKAQLGFVFPKGWKVHRREVYQRDVEERETAERENAAS